MDWGVWMVGGGAALGLVIGVVREIERSRHPDRPVQRRGTRMPVDPDVRTRKVIDESLDIAMHTKRRATAESRLQVVEDALDDLSRRGKEIVDDRITRHTMMRLREGLDRRFPSKRKK